MNKIDFIQHSEVFTSLWQRAQQCMNRALATPASELLHFDSSNICSRVFHDLIRDVANFNGTGDFAVIVLKPDPFSYFHFHFGKYSGFVVREGNSEDDFADILMRDPGDSPADAIGFYSEQYVVSPIVGDMVHVCQSRLGLGHWRAIRTKGSYGVCKRVICLL
jgi:hypothetical protein